MSDPIDEPVWSEPEPPRKDPKPRIGLKASGKELQDRLFQLRRNREAKWWQDVLSTEAGQAMVMMIMDGCHVYSDKKLDDFAQGQRSVAVGIIRQLHEISPAVYPDLLDAHFQRQLKVRANDFATAENLAHVIDAQNA